MCVLLFVVKGKLCLPRTINNVAARFIYYETFQTLHIAPFAPAPFGLGSLAGGGAAQGAYIRTGEGRHRCPHRTGHRESGQPERDDADQPPRRIFAVGGDRRQRPRYLLHDWLRNAPPPASPACRQRASRRGPPALREGYARNRRSHGTGSADGDNPAYHQARHAFPALHHWQRH